MNNNCTCACTIKCTWMHIYIYEMGELRQCVSGIHSFCAPQEVLPRIETENDALYAAKRLPPIDCCLVFAGWRCCATTTATMSAKRSLHWHITNTRTRITIFGRCKDRHDVPANICGRAIHFWIKQHAQHIMISIVVVYASSAAYRATHTIITWIRSLRYVQWFYSL